MSRFTPYKLFVFDTGTTGLDPTTDSITQMAVVSLHGRPNHFHTYVDDNFPAAFAKMRAHIQSVMKYNQIAVLVAHNVAFDASMLQAEISRHKLQAPDWLYSCSYKLARYLLPDGTECSQGKLARYYQVHVEKEHDCFNDVLVLREILLKIVRRTSRHVPDLLYDSATPLRQAAADEVSFLHAGFSDEESDEELPTVQAPIDKKEYKRSGYDGDIAQALTKFHVDDGESYIVTPKGKRYHVKETCRGLRNASAKLRVSEIPRDKTPCGVCVKKRS